MYEEQTTYTKVVHYKCGCGAIFYTEEEFWEHSKENGYVDHLGFVCGFEKVPTGTEIVQTGTIHHEEVGHWEPQVYKEAYDETVVTGYICSECGATK